MSSEDEYYIAAEKSWSNKENPGLLLRCLLECKDNEKKARIRYIEELVKRKKEATIDQVEEDSRVSASKRKKLESKDKRLKEKDLELNKKAKLLTSLEAHLIKTEKENITFSKSLEKLERKLDQKEAKLDQKEAALDAREKDLDMVSKAKVRQLNERRELKNAEKEERLSKLFKQQHEANAAKVKENRSSSNANKLKSAAKKLSKKAPKVNSLHPPSYPKEKDFPAKRT